MTRCLIPFAALSLLACGSPSGGLDASGPEIDVRVITEAASRSLARIPLRLIVKDGALADTDGRPARGEALTRSLELIQGDPLEVVLHVEGRATVDSVAATIDQLVAAFRARTLPGATRLRLFVVSEAFEKPLRR